MTTPQGQHDSARAIQARLILLHTVWLTAFLFPITMPLVVLALVSFALRMIGIELGYHRYFSHRSFQTSRLFQFILALLATSSGQRGVIAWAEHHRKHHRHSDTEQDPHSPVRNSFWYAHVAWIWKDEHRNPTYKHVRDLTKFPELTFIDRHHYIATYGLMALLFVLGEFSPILGRTGMGLQAMFWGFMIPTLVTYQITMSINSLYHSDRLGNRAFETSDHSRNVWWMAIPSMGAAWHNNHHRYGSAARAGFHWWQIDISYYIIRALGFLGLVWDIREVPARVLQELEENGSTDPAPVHQA